jgi:ABC-type arginine transport system ATPase subunit
MDTRPSWAPGAADPDVHAEAIGSVSRLVGEPVTGVMVGCYGIDFSIRSAPRVLMMSSGRLLTIRRSV